jgi:hypothetical protein
MQQFSKYFYFLLLFLFCFQTISAQEPDKTVSITVSGSGKTQDEAKQSALRSAIEQAFGAFISSKTEMFNDKVVADQIASVANGNIQSFAILTESQLPDGSWGVTLKAVVSVSKLTSFVAAKGISIEIKGGMFALNIKQQLLNEQGEIKAIAEMVGLLHEPMQISFDYIIKSSDPKSLDAESKNWEIPLVVTATTNKNMDFCATYCVKTLEALTLTAEEVQNYEQLNKKVFPVTVNYSGIRKTYYLRKQGSIDILNTLGSQWEFYTRLFTVQSGMDEKIGIGEDKLHQFSSNNNNNYNSYGNYDAYSFNFLSSGQIAGTFSWSDKRTLAEIEKITDYSVKPRGVISAFKYGGFVIYEKDGKGLVLGISDLGGEKLWKEANDACNELVLNGYDDWRLPKPEEFREIHESRFWWNVGNLKIQKSYWSNYLEVDKNSYSSVKKVKAKTFYLNRDYKLDEYLRDTASPYSNYNQDNYKQHVRPVRTFQNNITIQVKNTSTIPSDISGLTEEELQDKNLSQLLIYSGIYNVTGKPYANLGFKILITFENEKLFLAFTSDRENTEDKKLEIKKTTLDEFENQELKVKIQFNRDDKGKIASLKYLFKKTEINAVK